MSDERKRVVLLPGDGVGPEVLEAAASVLEAARVPVTLEIHAFGGAAIDRYREPLPPETLAACENADAILLGAVGGPKWDGAEVRPESGLLALRKKLGLFANLRPVRPLPCVAERSSPLKPELLAGVDLLVVRELTGGLYFGRPRTLRREPGLRTAIDTAEYRDDEVRRISELAFRLAKSRSGRVTSIDKANVLQTSRLWREVVTEVHERFPEVRLDHQLVDSAAMRLITHPSSFDVVLAGNLFGDILSDESSVLAGGIGLLPSASLGRGSRGLYEPIHGSAPDIAGTGTANPVGTILSAAMMLEHSFDQPYQARRIQTATEKVLEDGARTRDLGGQLSTREMTSAIIGALEH